MRPANNTSASSYNSGPIYFLSSPAYRINGIFVCLFFFSVVSRSPVSFCEKREPYIIKKKNGQMHIDYLREIFRPPCLPHRLQCRNDGVILRGERERALNYKSSAENVLFFFFKYTLERSRNNITHV